DVDAILAAEKLARLTLISQAVEALVAPDERRRGFFRVAGAATRAYRALLPDDRAAPYLKPVATLHVLAEALRGKLGPVDISAVSAKIEALLDEKIEGVAITAPIIEGDRPAGPAICPALTSRSSRRCSRSVRGLRLNGCGQTLRRRHVKWRSATRPASSAWRSWRSSSSSLDVEVFFEALKKLIAEMEEEERRAVREG